MLRCAQDALARLQDALLDLAKLAGDERLTRDELLLEAVEERGGDASLRLGSVGLASVDHHDTCGLFNEHEKYSRTKTESVERTKNLVNLRAHIR